jgi:ubiquitin carboxyl-terminal hydrolase 34
MDLSIEKTNSAYMLFYEKVDAGDDEATAGPSTEPEVVGSSREGTFDLSPALEEWIWQDNKNFIQDNNIFDHSYFRCQSSSLFHSLLKLQTKKLVFCPCSHGQA